MRYKLQFASILILCAFLSGCVTAPRKPEISKEQAKKNHEVDTGPFWWGTSTSSYQNEDNHTQPGSPDYFLTDWDLFEQEGRSETKGKNATYSWSHFDKDVEALKKLGVTHFRLSIEWARVEPQPGVFNEKAIRQYVSMVKRVKEAGIEPIVTLWHFTFPSWLYDTKDKRKANFLHPDMPERWRAYVTRMVQELKPYVRYFVPQNEPNGAVQLGYLGGHWPPGLLLKPFSYKKAMKVCVDTFREAADIIHGARKDAVVMSVQSMPYWRRNFFMDPTAVTYNTMIRQNYDHLDQVQDVVDLIGINYYYSQDATIPRFIYRPQGERSAGYTQMGWQIDPEGIYHVIREVGDRYKKPIIIVENGIGTLNEQKRIKYFRDHINQMRRAAGDGYDIRGYFPWTLVDNYEWTEGYTTNFGLTRMDPTTKERLLEPSAYFFRNVIRSAQMTPKAQRKETEKKPEISSPGTTTPFRLYY